MLILNSKWYRREEQLLRTAFWYNTFAGVFGGVLSYAIGKINGPLATWKVSLNLPNRDAVSLGSLCHAMVPHSPFPR